MYVEWIGRRAMMLALLGLTSCSYGSTNLQVAPGSQVGGTGDIQYDHRELGGGMHTVTVIVRPGLAETESSMSQRNQQFGSTFAGQQCPKGFEFVNPPEPDRLSREGLAQRTRTYTFRCRTA
jgi:hypothetical protein